MRGLDRPKSNAVGEIGAGVTEQAVEDPSHSKDGWAGIDAAAVDCNPAQLAAGRCGSLKHEHVEARSGEVDGGGKPPDPGSDDHDARRPRHVSPVHPEICICFRRR